MRELNEARKLNILGACVVMWQGNLVDATVDTHDRIIGNLYRDAERQCAERFHQEKRVVRNALAISLALGQAMLFEELSDQPVSGFIESRFDWEALRSMVSGAERLSSALSDDPLEYVIDGYVRLRPYAPRMIRMIEFECPQMAKPILR